MKKLFLILSVLVSGCATGTYMVPVAHCGDPKPREKIERVRDFEYCEIKARILYAPLSQERAESIAQCMGVRDYVCEIKQEERFWDEKRKF